jgi:hypothetical protein
LAKREHTLNVWTPEAAASAERRMLAELDARRLLARD